MPKPCYKVHPNRDPKCRVCHLWHESPGHRLKWWRADIDGPLPQHRTLKGINTTTVPRSHLRYSLECEFRGPPTGEVVQCGLCGKYDKMIPVYSCPVHGRCITENVRRKADTPQWCKTCKEKCNLRWSYGVTTVPSRRDNVFPRTLASLKAAGFPNPHLFVDGDTNSESWVNEFGLNVTARWPRVKTAANWCLSLAELYTRDAYADRYAVFQDDFVTYKNLRAYLESVPYPQKGYLNLYSFPKNESLADGRAGFYPSDRKSVV